MTEKKIPRRMCAICRNLYSKRELIRIVKTAKGEVFVDATGKQPGRGVYLCYSSKCIEQALKGSRLSKILGVVVDEAFKEQLKEVANHETTF